MIETKTNVQAIIWGVMREFSDLPRDFDDYPGSDSGIQPTSSRKTSTRSDSEHPEQSGANLGEVFY
jgi:hypothetical protein